MRAVRERAAGGVVGIEPGGGGEGRDAEQREAAGQTAATGPAAAVIS
jgi:hypothetical protein